MLLWQEYISNCNMIGVYKLVLLWQEYISNCYCGRYGEREWDETGGKKSESTSDRNKREDRKQQARPTGGVNCRERRETGERGEGEGER